MNEKHDDTWLWNRSGEPDEDVRRLETLLAPLAHDAATPLRIVAPTGRRHRWSVVAAIAAVVLSALGVGVWAVTRDGDAVGSRADAPSLLVDAERVGESTWIDAPTGDVELALGETMGRITLEAGGRLQVRRLDAEVTRLYLDRGRMTASIAADVKPRFFQVDTPATRCIDLGCQYTLEVDEDGNAFVHVLTGRVAFENDGDEVYVPANATCRAKQGGRAGTPRFRDTPALLVAALDAYDAAGGAAPEERLRLAQALCDHVERVADTLGVWHLLRDPDPRITALAQAALARIAGSELDEIPTSRQGWKAELQWWWY